MRNHSRDFYLFGQCKHHKGKGGLIYGVGRNKGQKQARRNTGWLTDRVSHIAPWNSYLWRDLTFLSLNSLRLDSIKTRDRMGSRKKVIVFKRTDWMDINGNGSQDHCSPDKRVCLLMHLICCKILRRGEPLSPLNCSHSPIVWEGRKVTKPGDS